MAWFWSDAACFSLHHGVLFYVISFEVSGSSAPPTPGPIHEGENCHYDQLFGSAVEGTLVQHTWWLPCRSHCLWELCSTGANKNFLNLDTQGLIQQSIPSSERKHSAGQTLQLSASTLTAFLSHSLRLQRDCFQDPGMVFYRLEGCINIFLCLYSRIMRGRLHSYQRSWAFSMWKARIPCKL